MKSLLALLAAAATLAGCATYVPSSYYDGGPSTRPYAYPSTSAPVYIDNGPAYGAYGGGYAPGYGIGYPGAYAPAPQVIIVAPPRRDVHPDRGHRHDRADRPDRPRPPDGRPRPGPRPDAQGPRPQRPGVRNATPPPPRESRPSRTANQRPAAPPKPQQPGG